MTYRDFLEAKVAVSHATGIEVHPAEIHPMLFPFQRDLVRWSLRKGHAGIFADAGLGKTFMSLEWARLTGERTLILAPLSVAKQTVREGHKIDIEVVYARKQEEAGSGITITNYEMVDHFEPEAFGAVVLDESSILKATEGVYRNRLIDLFAHHRFRLCCTATPAPNDIQEITNHSAFLSVMKRRDVLATFFLHESDDARASGWRLKRHAREAFWRWLASWGMSVKHPSDLGYEDDGYNLTPLDSKAVVIEEEIAIPGRLPGMGRIRGITDRAAVRKQSLKGRVEAAVKLIRESWDNNDATTASITSKEPWIAWCGLNAEQDLLTEALGDDCISVYGSLSPEEKQERLEAWLRGDAPVLVSKVSVCGFGLNLQRAARQVFVGINDSFEQYYQAVRRSWRYGQTRPVVVRVVVSEPEVAVYENVLRKEREADQMARELVKHVAAFERAEIQGVTRGLKYDAHSEMQIPEWLETTG